MFVSCPVDSKIVVSRAAAKSCFFPVFFVCVWKWWNKKGKIFFLQKWKKKEFPVDINILTWPRKQHFFKGWPNIKKTPTLGYAAGPRRKPWSCVVVGRDEQIGEHDELVVRELLLVVLPVVVVCAAEIRQRFLHRQLQERKDALHLVVHFLISYHPCLRLMLWLTKALKSRRGRGLNT